MSPMVINHRFSLGFGFQDGFNLAHTTLVVVSGGFRVFRGRRLMAMTDPMARWKVRFAEMPFVVAGSLILVAWVIAVATLHPAVRRAEAAKAAEVEAADAATDANAFK
jgi:hypothetical protein